VPWNHGCPQSSRAVESWVSSILLPTEYVRHLIREDQKREAERRLEAKLLEGLDSELSDESLDDFLNGLRKRVRAASRRKRA
jgi:hypothetical protein